MDAENDSGLNTSSPVPLPSESSNTLAQILAPFRDDEVHQLGISVFMNGSYLGHRPGIWQGAQGNIYLSSGIRASQNSLGPNPDSLPAR